MFPNLINILYWLTAWNIIYFQHFFYIISFQTKKSNTGDKLVKIFLPREVHCSIFLPRLKYNLAQLRTDIFRSPYLQCRENPSATFYKTPKYKFMSSVVVSLVVLKNTSSVWKLIIEVMECLLTSFPKMKFKSKSLLR